MTSSNVSVYSVSESESKCGESRREKVLFDWLHSLELTHHFDKFLDHGYEDLEICMEIGEADLHAIGVSDIHERLALLQSVRSLRQQHQQQQQQQQKKSKSKSINNNNKNELSAISPLVESADANSASMTSNFHPPVTSSLYSTWNYPRKHSERGNAFFTSKPASMKYRDAGMQCRRDSSMTDAPSLPMRNAPASFLGYRFDSESDNRNYVEVNDDELGDGVGQEPLYESVSPVPELYAIRRGVGGCRSNPMTPKRFLGCANVRDGCVLIDANNRNEKISGLNHPRVGCEEEVEEGSFSYESHHPGPPPGMTLNLARLRTQLRDQVMQDGINISRISDEGILRSMAAQYAAELASTMTLTPSSTSACSTSSESSNLSNCSSSSGPTHHPGDAHYQHVFSQLRELWLEERMKLYPLPNSECTCGEGNANGRLMAFKSSAASTPSATTPSGGQPECIMTVIHNSTLAAPRSVPCLASNTIHNNGNINKLASPERSHNQQTPHHQYLQHVIISNNFPGQSPGHCSVNNKQNYTPGIYLPSSCLLDKDEIYDYAPPVRISPQRRNLSPAKRSLQAVKGNGRNGNANLSTLLKGSSKSSYALSSNANAIYGSNFDNFPKPVAAKTGSCRTLANLSKLSRRLGLSRFFRTLKIHGNSGTQPPTLSRQSNARLQAGSGCSRCSEEFQESCECQFHAGRGTLPDLTLNARRYPGRDSNEKITISSLPSNERIIQTINRLKLEELEKRKERIAQEHRMVRDTLFYMLPRN